MGSEFEKFLTTLATLDGIKIDTVSGEIPSFGETVPTITKVKSFNNKTTVVFFSDGTKETAVCSEEDTYSLEQGITVCLAKKACGKNYNKIVHTAAKRYYKDIEDQKKTEKQKKEAHEERMRIQQNRAEKRRKKQEAANAAIIAAGILEALQELSDADMLKIETVK